MPRLFLLRHAQAEPHDPRLSDHGRALSERGRAEAVAIGAAMRAAEPMAAAATVLVSSARRTLETLRLALPGHDGARVLDTLYLADAGTLADILRGSGAEPCILLIGHNPGLHELALRLAPAGAEPEALRRGLPTAGLAAFDLPEPWAGLRWGSAAPRRFVCPADLDPAHLDPARPDPA